MIVFISYVSSTFTRAELNIGIEDNSKAYGQLQFLIIKFKNRPSLK